MNEWQPIETAPKDGTEIILSYSDGLIIGFWHDALEDWVSWVWSDNCTQMIFKVNYWMPLPEPPKE